MQQLHLFPFVFGTGDGHLEQAAVKLHSCWSVIVSGYGVRQQAGIAVRVHYTHSGNAHLCCISYSNVLLKDIVQRGKEDDKIWQADSWAIPDVGIGKETSLPVPCVGKLPTFLRSALYKVAKLTTAADKQYDASTIGYMRSEV